MEKAKAAGCEIIEIADKKPFQDAVKPVWDKYGPKYEDMIKRIQADLGLERTLIHSKTGGSWSMAGLFRRAMDYLYRLCVIVGVIALVLISAVIPWAVFTRYVLNSAASWPEPLAVLSDHPADLHRRRGRLPAQSPHERVLLRRPVAGAVATIGFDLLVQLLMAVIAIFMIVWGERLVEVTWYNTIADFPFLSVGVTYLPIPVGGVCLLLFIIERIFIGLPPRSDRASRRTSASSRLIGRTDHGYLRSPRDHAGLLRDRHADRLFAGDGRDRRRPVGSAFRSKP